jgi:hypothetical protein
MLLTQKLLHLSIVCCIWKDKNLEFKTQFYIFSCFTELYGANARSSFNWKRHWRNLLVLKPELPDFFLTQYTKMGWNIPNCLNVLNGHNIIQMAVEFTFRGPPKFSQIGLFGLIMYHLATLHPNGEFEHHFCSNGAVSTLATANSGLHLVAAFYKLCLVPILQPYPFVHRTT